MTGSKVKLKNLFHPGDGRIPPLLTGREQEQNYFRDCVDILLDGTSPDQNMIVYGPRGNGKTAMLRYLQKETLEKTGSRLDIAWVTPRKVETLEGLARAISGTDLKILDKVRNLGVSASMGMVGFNAELDLSRATAVTEDLLREKSRKTPLVLIMDEAHSLTPDMAAILLDASQNVRGEDCPFFLVMAGTPNLRTELRKTNATFWSRSAMFPLGRLSSEEAQEAITIPLKRHQVTFDQEASMEVLGRAHRYPYFIQVWGDCIAKRLVATDSREVTMDTVREIERAVMIKCHGMYQDRYDELQELDLHWLAAHIGQAFSEKDRKNIAENEFKELVGKALRNQGMPATHASILDNIRKLSHIGYIWEVTVPGNASGEYPLLCYEPGIPSLMQYIERQVLGQDS